MLSSLLESNPVTRTEPDFEKEMPQLCLQGILEGSFELQVVDASSVVLTDRMKTYLDRVIKQIKIDPQFAAIMKAREEEYIRLNVEFFADKKFVWPSEILHYTPEQQALLRPHVPHFKEVRKAEKGIWLVLALVGIKIAYDYFSQQPES